MSMTDRELLELAAKAAGMPPEGMEGGEPGPMSKGGLVWGGGGQCIDWNPLNDDGDALRLAVKLAQTRPGASFAISISKMHDGRGFADAGFFSHVNPTEQALDEDVAKATRRAIVRAAAELGRSMP